MAYASPQTLKPFGEEVRAICLAVRRRDAPIPAGHREHVVRERRAHALVLHHKDEVLRLPGAPWSIEPAAVQRGAATMDSSQRQKRKTLFKRKKF